jgi:hypothetical protein
VNDELFLRVGDRVRKTMGVTDYTFEGVIVSVFTKRNGVFRYVIEDDRGLLVIMAPHEVERWPHQVER